MARNGRAGESARGRRAALRPDHASACRTTSCSTRSAGCRSRSRSCGRCCSAAAGSSSKTGEGVRRLPAKAVAAGPLGLFLEQTIGRRRRGEDGRGVLHVINIRDWHVPDDNYDYERRRYGAHCEAGTWGAGYVDGLEGWLDPAGPLPSEEARYFEEGSVRIHHVHADSIFDFRPRRAHIGADERKFRASALEVLLDVIVQGSEADQERARELLRADPRVRALWPLAEEIDDDETVRSSARALRRRDRLLHRHQGGDRPRRAAHALRAPEPRGLRHVHGQREPRAPPRRARLRREAPDRRGRARDQRPRPLPRRHGRPRGRVGDRRRRQLLPLPGLLPGPPERARPREREAARSTSS